MPRSWMILGVVVMMTACGGSTSPDDDGDPPGNTVTNVRGTTNRTVSLNGVQRQFVVHVGATVGANAPAPVVFMFHGTSGDGPQFYNISGWKEKADQEGLIAVFPSALTYCFFEDENQDGDFGDAGERKVTTKWTHGQLGDPAEMPLCTPQEIATLNAQNQALVNHPFQEDVLFVDAMIAFLRQNYLVDDKAIYSTGFSNGAQFSNRLAVERSQVFAATAAHAGGTSVPTTNGRLMSVVSSIGSLDDRMTGPLGVTEIPIGPTTLESYPTIAYVMVLPLLNQLKLAQAYTYSEVTVGGKRLGRWVFSTSTAGGSNSLTFVLFEDNYHTYPNGVSYPLVMANLLWDFFRTQRLP